MHWCSSYGTSHGAVEMWDEHEQFKNNLYSLYSLIDSVLNGT